jgi:hypothetical protein
MPKKCIICGENAEYFIKDTSDYYCKDCAAENFGDISMLVKVEEQAKLLKKLVERAGEKSLSKKDLYEISEDDESNSDKDIDIQDEDYKRNEKSRLNEPEPEKEDDKENS